MNKVSQVVFLCYIWMIVLVWINFGDANDNTVHRTRRYLSFRNNSKFFLRLNFKANMVPWNQIFAQVHGFRINWDEPPDTFRPYEQLRVHRRSVYETMETLLNRNGLNGFHCIRRAVCETKVIAEPKSIYHQILKTVFRRSSSTGQWHNASTDECQLSIGLCPLSILEASYYTDL